MRLILACLLALPALARPLTPEESEALGDRVDGFVEALGSGEVAPVLEVLPPRLLDHMSETSGIPAEELIDDIADTAERAMVEMSIEDVATEMTALEAEDGDEEDGTVTWTFVPTSFTVDMGESAVAFDTSILAIKDGSDWYLVRVSEPAQIELIRELYPSLADIEFPETTTSFTR